MFLTLRRSLLTLFCAYVGFIFAGINFQKMTEYSDFHEAAQANPLVGLAFNLVVYHRKDHESVSRARARWRFPRRGLSMAYERKKLDRRRTRNLENCVPLASRDEIKNALPDRNWLAIKKKASEKKIHRHNFTKDGIGDLHLSVNDVAIMEKYGLEQGDKRVWWITDTTRTDDSHS